MTSQQSLNASVGRNNVYTWTERVGNEPEPALASFSSFSFFFNVQFFFFLSFFTPTAVSFSLKLPHFAQRIFFFSALVPQDANIPCDPSPIHWGIPLPLSKAKNERKNETSSFPAVSFASLLSSSALVWKCWMIHSWSFHYFIVSTFFLIFRALPLISI